VRVVQLDREVLQLESRVRGAQGSEGDAVLIRTLRDEIRELGVAAAEAKKLKQQAQ
jgi:hypothetical protein